MFARFRHDPLVLAQLVEGKWEVLPPEGWSLCHAAQLTDINERSVKRRGSGLIYARSPRQHQNELELVIKFPEKWVLLTTTETRLPGDLGIGVLRVPDLSAARNNIAMVSREQYRGKIVAVTGSVGKTTVRRMVDTTLRARHTVHTSRRIDNGFKVLRDQLLSLSDEEYATFEIARIALPGGEQLAKPDVAVIGALAEAHMEALGSLQNIARVKGQLLKGVRESGTGVINIDSPNAAELLQIAMEQKIDVTTYGQHPEADIRLMHYDPRTSECQVQVFGEQHCYLLSAPGRHNAVNSLAVLGVLRALELPISEYLDALSSFTPVRGRGKAHELVISGKSVTVVDESYNANPTSMRAALEAFGNVYTDRRKLLVLGDMLELGPTSRELHVGLVPDIVSLSPGLVVLVGPYMKELYEALPDTQAALHVEDADRLDDTVIQKLRDQDAVFLKASKGMKLRGVVEEMVKYGKDGVAG